MSHLCIKDFSGVFLGGLAVKNLPANARDMGSIPGRGRSHMPWSNGSCALQLLSLCSIAQELQLVSPRVAVTEATFLEPMLSNRSHYNETLTTTRESPYGQIKLLIKHIFFKKTSLVSLISNAYMICVGSQNGDFPRWNMKLALMHRILPWASLVYFPIQCDKLSVEKFKTTEISSTTWRTVVHLISQQILYQQDKTFCCIKTGIWRIVHYYSLVYPDKYRVRG